MNNYRDRLKKRITLPSGFAVTIEKINALNSPFIEKRVSESDTESGLRLTVFILTHKVGPFDGMKIVEKVTNKDAEIGIDEIEQEDIDCITQSVLEFSGLTKRGQEARKTFPEAQTDSAQRSQAGKAVSGPSADGVAGAANG